MVGWMNGNNNVLPFVGMVIAMVAQSGSMVVIKAAMIDEMNKSEHPPLNFSTLCSFFVLSLFGCSGQIFAYVGIELSSPTLASATLNLIPALTFLLALIFRMEKVNWREYSSQAKVIGTIVSIAGAFVVILYKGPPLFKTHSLDSSNYILQLSPKLNWILGGLFCAGDSLVCAMWYIYQATVSKKYPVVMVIVFFQILFSTIQSSVFALITVRDPKAWELKLDMGLIAILYQAIGATAIRYILCTWCVQRAGPLFCAMFKPMAIIFTVLMGALFLGDDFNLGSLIGAIIIVVGFYAVMWGKATEDKEVERGGIENALESSCHVVPLLQNKA